MKFDLQYSNSLNSMNGLLEFAHDNQWYEIAFDKRSVHRFRQGPFFKFMQKLSHCFRLTSNTFLIFV